MHRLGDSGKQGEESDWGTLCLRHTATRKDIEESFLLAHQLGCQGVTVFRDGCKQKQVLRLGDIEGMRPFGAEPCPECGEAMIVASGCISCFSCGYAFCSI